jgi:hypothetical protein
MSADVGCHQLGPGTLRIDRAAFHAPIRANVVSRMRQQLEQQGGGEQGIIVLQVCCGKQQGVCSRVQRLSGAHLADHVTLLAPLVPGTASLAPWTA